MKLTNHVRRIEVIAGQIIKYADDCEYEKVQCALDDMEAEIHAMRRHLEKLQWLNSRAQPAASFFNVAL